MTQAAALKARLAREEILVAPGIYDALSAVLAEQAGFEALFLSGSALAYTQLGRPDIGLVTMTEVVDACARIADRVAVPILVDIDSGFGNAVHAGRTLRALEQAGAAAVQIEDQAPIKPAHSLTSRPLVAPQAMADTIKALVDDRRGDTLISARTDAPASEPLERTLERLALYREAGADLVFAEGLTEPDHVRAVTRAAGGVPVLYNLLHAGRAIASADQLQALGVSLALFPGNAVLAHAAALQSAFAALKADPRLPTDGFAVTPADLNTALGAPELFARYTDFS